MFINSQNSNDLQCFCFFINVSLIIQPHRIVFKKKHNTFNLLKSFYFSASGDF